MGPFPHDAPPARSARTIPPAPTASSSSNSPIPSRRSSKPCSARWAMSRSRGTRPEGHLALSPGRHQLRAQSRSGLSRGALRRRARSVRARHGVARRRCPACAEARARSRCDGIHGSDKSLDVPAVIGIGGSLLYFVDRYGAKGSPYADRISLARRRRSAPGGRRLLLPRPPDAQRHARQHGHLVPVLCRHVQFPRDPLLQHRGQADRAARRALTSPCGKIRIPINESADDKSQIEEYLRQYKGEGIQHIAVGTDDIYAATDAIAQRGARVHAGTARPLLRQVAHARAGARGAGRAA